MSTNKHLVYKLKIRTTHSSLAVFPFDVAYLCVTKEDVKRVSDSFQAAFSFEMTKNMIQSLQCLPLHYLEEHKLYRTSIPKDAVGYRAKGKGFNQNKVTLHHPTTKDSLCTKVGDKIPSLQNGWYAVIPSLVIKEKGKSRLVYTVKKSTLDSIKSPLRDYGRRVLSDIPNMKLINQGVSVSPCSTCSNAVVKMTDPYACNLGTQACLDHISISNVDNKKGNEYYKGSSHTQETKNIKPAYKGNSLCIYAYPTHVHKDYPKICDDMSLAFFTGKTNRSMTGWISKIHEETAYRHLHFNTYWANGGVKKTRYCQEPQSTLKEMHKTIADFLGGMPHPTAIGAYTKGRNTAHAAKQHCRKRHWVSEEEYISNSDFVQGLKGDARYKVCRQNKVSSDPTTEPGYSFWQPVVLIRLDIVDYFNSIKVSHIRNTFIQHVGWSSYVSGLFANLCSVRMYHPKDKAKTGKKVVVLPQGSPLSGAVANIVGYHRFGQHIEKILEVYSPDWVYTIYSDDIVLSHPDETVSQKELDEITREITGLVEDPEYGGYKINRKKTRIERCKDGNVVIHGYTIYDGIDVPREVRDSLKTNLTLVIKNGWASRCKATGKDSAASVEAYIRGMIQYVKQGNPGLAKKLSEMHRIAKLKHPIDVNDYIEEVSLNG